MCECCWGLVGIGGLVAIYIALLIFASESEHKMKDDIR